LAGFALPIFTKSDDADRGAGDLRHLLGAIALKAGGPQSACLPVAKEVSAAQLGEALAAIDPAAGDAAGNRVRQRDQRRADRRWPDRVRLDRLRAFHCRPAVVAALLDAVDHLPQFPADVADEQLAGLAVEAHAPGIAEAIRPNLRTSARQLYERVVSGNGIRLPWIFAIDVDAQDRR
jgi:hypothetical protein